MKKLTTILLAVLLILIGKSQAVTLTQVVGENYIHVEVDEGQQISLSFTDQQNYTFTYWTVEEGNLSLDAMDNPNITFTMPNYDVTIKGHYKEENVTVDVNVTFDANGGSLGGEISTLQVGDYVTYVPTNTSYTVDVSLIGDKVDGDEVFYPSQTTLWRVFSKNGTTVELISESNVGDLYLDGEAGFNNLESVLQDISDAYIDENLVQSARHFGSSDPYTTDVNILVDNELQSTGTIWIPSKDGVVDEKSGEGSCIVRFFENGSVNEEYIIDEKLSNDTDAYGIRPIVQLKTTAVLSGGAGTSVSPYILGTEAGPSTITVTSGNAYGTLPTPVRKDYNFAGWYTSPTGGTQVTSTTIVTNTTNHTLYAKWGTTTFTITFNANGGSGIMSPQTAILGEPTTLSANTFTRSSYEFLGWSKTSSSTTPTYMNGEAITPTTDITLYAIWAPYLTNVASVGSYVTYVPSSTSYMDEFNPSSSTSWRVFSNDGTNVEIISTGSVGTLYILSQYSTRPGDGFANSVQKLNDMSRAYINPMYATSGRSLGYYDEKIVNSDGTFGSNMTEAQKANYKAINTTLYPLDYNVSGFPYEDFQYKPDLTVLSNHSLMCAGNVWLAAREAYRYDTNFYFCGYFMDSNGDIDVDSMYSIYNKGESDSAVVSGNGVRPIITLKSNVAVTGTGTEADPYVINESNPSQYTVTYSANGGYGEMNPQSVAQGSAVTLATNAYEHHSATFLGWSTDATATSATYTNKQTITPTADMTLYAVWGESTVPTLSASWKDNISDELGMIYYMEIVDNIEDSIYYSYFDDITTDEFTTYNADVDETGKIKVYYNYNEDGEMVVVIAGNSQGSIKAPENSSELFEGLSSVMQIYGLDMLDTSGVTDMNYMFAGCNGLESLDLSSFDTGAVTDMSYMFMECNNLISLDLSNFDTSAVTDMSYMFSTCELLESIDLSSFDTSAVTNMACMFEITALKEIDISSFDTSAVTDMSCMFNGTLIEEITLGPDFEFVMDPISDESIVNYFADESGIAIDQWYIADGTLVNIGAHSGTVTYYAVKPATLLSDIATVGAYVTYVPSSTSYTVPTTVSGHTSDQTFNPSNTTSWRVFSNDGTNVEIISTDSVGDLTLNGETGYVNAVQTLNDMSASYVNNTYAESGRSLGYYDEKKVSTYGYLGADMTKTEKSNYKTINITSYPIEYGVTTDFPYNDSQYKPDTDILSNHGSMYHTTGYVWLASRTSNGGGYGIDGTNFYVGKLDASGTGRGDYLFGETSDGSGRSTHYNAGVRPIIKLKSGITITGSGTADDPYIINESNPTQYTVTYSANGGYGEMNPQSVIQGSSVTLATNAYEHHTESFLGWSTSATATTATYTNGQTITPTADMTLYAVWGETLASKVNAGDYITYKPSSTSYTVPYAVSGYTTNQGYETDQTYNPSSTTSWRVFSVDGENVEIISTDSIGTLYLRGKDGYINAVQTLNDLSTAYVNPEYAISGRSLGYYDATRYTSDTDSGSAMTETEKANYKIINTVLKYGLSGFPYIDYQYMPDKTILDNHGSMYHSSGYIWLASRSVSTQDQRSHFRVSRMFTSGSVSTNYDYYYANLSSGTMTYYAVGNGVRPVISLKSNLTITGGTGTESDPYIINESNPSQYTVTYCSNGGYGEMNPQSVTQGSSLKLTANTYEHYSLSFLGWSTSATARTVTYTNGQTITPTADTTLYAVWGVEGTALEAGDYVTYVPSSTSCTVPTTVSGYTSNQIYNPSSTTSWRVLNVNGENIEIISADSVGNLYLSGVAGYTNAVQTLNDLSTAYVNPEYAISGRSLGYYDATRYTSDTDSGSAMTETEKANYKIINTSLYPIEHGVSDFPYTNWQYCSDANNLNLSKVKHNKDTCEYVWLASRSVTGASSNSFYVKVMNYSGSVSNYYYKRLCDVNSSDSVTQYSNECGVRPIITLKPNTITGGSGTEDDPYVINESNPSQYTVTYSANGGYGEMNPQSVTQGSSMALATNTYKHHSETFLGWSTSATATTATYTNRQSITPTSNMTLYAVWGQPPVLSDVATVGAYVTYTPSSTSYTVPTTVSGHTSNQTYNPSNVTSWRVFSVDGEDIEIIRTDNGGNLILKGDIGYINVVQTLNDISMAFVNNTYATSGRSLGYYDEKVVNSDGTLGDDMTEIQKADYKTASTLYIDDDQYKPDKAVLDSYDLNKSYTWLASRWMMPIEGYTYFYGTGLDGNGDYDSTRLYGIDPDGSTETSSGGRYICPIIKLKSGLTVTGSGTEADPYVINETNPSQYTVTYCANGGYGDMVPQSVTQGSSITLTANTYDNHSKLFLGWSTDATATAATYTDGQTITPTSDMTLYAVWGGHKYTIRYYANGGSGEGMERQSVVEGDTVTLTSNTFTKDFHTFLGWSTDSDATTATYTDGQTITPTSDMKLFAVWGYLCEIRYNANGGSGTMEPQTVIAGESVTLTTNTFTKTFSFLNYKFLGWSTDSNATTATYTDGQTITPTSDMTLYAVWGVF